MEKSISRLFSPTPHLLSTDSSDLKTTSSQNLDSRPIGPVVWTP